MMSLQKEKSVKLVEVPSFYRHVSSHTLIRTVIINRLLHKTNK